MLIYYVRHGYPCYNPDCLTKRGHFEANQVSDYLLDKDIEKIFSSTSNRAFETSQYLSKKLNKDVTQLSWAIEDNSAKYITYDDNGKLKWLFWDNPYTPILEKFQNDPEWFKREEFKDSKIKEGVDFINKSIDEWLLSMNIKRDQNTNTFTEYGETPENIAFFAHGGMGILFSACLSNINILKFMVEHYELDTCGICLFEINFDVPNGCKIIEYNRVVYDKEESLKIPTTI